MRKLRSYEIPFNRKVEWVKASSISERNKELILRYKDECFSLGLSKCRVLKYVHYLAKLALWIGKDFDKCSIEDVKRLVSRIEQSEYSAETKKEMKTYLRKLFTWFRGTDGYAPEVKWIKMNRKKCAKHKLPEDMITEAEVQKLIDAAQSTKLKALISMLYETGCRISELLFMQIRSVRFDKYGAIINVPPAKTGPRRIRVVSSVPLLSAWINTHPQKQNPQAYLWPSSQSELFSYGGIYSVLKRAARKAGVKKKVNPHNFRHSRATYLANFLTEAQMKEFFGWIQASDMASIYVHLSGRDVDKAILNVYGIKAEDTERKSVLSPKTCSRCKTDNPSSNKFCSICGMPLDKKSQVELIQNDLNKKEANSILDTMIKDEAFKEVFMEKVKEMLSAGSS